MVDQYLSNISFFFYKLTKSIKIQETKEKWSNCKNDIEEKRTKLEDSDLRFERNCIYTVDILHLEL